MASDSFRFMAGPDVGVVGYAQRPAVQQRTPGWDANVPRSRREVFVDHVVVLADLQLLRLVRAHANYYNEDRLHMALDRDTRAPAGRGTARRSATSS